LSVGIGQSPPLTVVKGVYVLCGLDCCRSGTAAANKLLGTH
jgi:hypothetical protein